MAKILIIDDDKSLCKLLVKMIEAMGHIAVSRFNLKEGLEESLLKPYDIVFLDVRMPDGSGLDILPDILDIAPAPEVIIITGAGTLDGAEIAIKSGAWDYIEKPFSMETIKLILTRTLQYREEKVSGKKPVVLKRKGIIGNSKQLKRCFDVLAQAASSNANVLISGETGTGKELFAKAIHDNHIRAGKNFVVVDCAALPETLVESMLFGHLKGTFTSADKDRDGLVKQADKGTLFLDEVGELPMTAQKAFLRVLQERSFRPVGAKQEIDSDFRLIAATNRNLDKLVQAGKFRNDLLFRIRTITIDLPPLRERKEDIKDLAMYYMSTFSDSYGFGIKGFSPEFLKALISYNWPGNVRELANTMEKALTSARNDATLFPMHLPTQIRIQLARASIGDQAANHTRPGQGSGSLDSFTNLKELLETTERQYLKGLISFTKGNIKKACFISGLSRSRMYDRLKRYKIPTK